METRRVLRRSICVITALGSLALAVDGLKSAQARGRDRDRDHDRECRDRDRDHGHGRERRRPRIAPTGTTPVAACPITADQVAIYEGEDLTGACMVLDPAIYTNAAEFGLADNSISSLQVGYNVGVILYNQQGSNIPSTYHDTFWPSGYTVYYVGSAFDNETSSIWVKPRLSSQIVAGYFLNDSPANYDGPWTTDPQGMAHDDTDFYITNTGNIFKYPITSTLTGTPSASTGIPPALSSLGCNHLGDLDARQSPSGQWYLFVPVEGCSVGMVIAVFNPDLSFVTWDTMFAPEQNGHASWLALRYADGITWVSSSTYELVNNSNPIISYQLNWDDIYEDPDGHYFLYGDYSTNFLTWDILSGSAEAALYHVQGGVYSDDGTVLYIANGASLTDFDCPNMGYVGSGVHAFRTSDFTGLASSSNGFGGFNYQNHPCDAGDYEEVEGIDFINMWNRGGAFNGFLHAVMVSNRGIDTDHSYIKHFNE